MRAIDNQILDTITGGGAQLRQEPVKEPLNTTWRFRGEHLMGKGQDLLESHGAPGKFIDVKGFPAGSYVRDPYTYGIFRMPPRRNVAGGR